MLGFFLGVAWFATWRALGFDLFPNLNDQE